MNGWVIGAALISVANSCITAANIIAHRPDINIVSAAAGAVVFAFLAGTSWKEPK